MEPRGINKNVDEERLTMKMRTENGITTVSHGSVEFKCNTLHEAWYYVDLHLFIQSVANRKKVPVDKHSDLRSLTGDGVQNKRVIWNISEEVIEVR